MVSSRSSRGASSRTPLARPPLVSWRPKATFASHCSSWSYRAIHPKRGRDASDAIGILPGYTGVSVHDGWKPYRHDTPCRHALFNIHHLRELTFVEEEYQQRLAKDLKALLFEMKAAM